MSDSNNDDNDDNGGFLGPSFNYSKHIRNPEAMQMEVSGDIWKLGNDVAVLASYIAVLATGESNANAFVDPNDPLGAKMPGATVRPLGNSFYLPTLATCQDINSLDSSGIGQTVQRSLFVNNLPVGNIPLLSGLTGQDFTMLRGLIPGVLSNLNVFDPTILIDTMWAGGSPPCVHTNFPTRNNKGEIVLDSSGYLTISDLNHLDPCAIAQIGNVEGINNYCLFNKKTWININDPSYNISCGGEGFETPCICNPLSGYPGSGEHPTCSPSGNQKYINDRIVGMPKQIGFQNMNENILDDILSEKNLKELMIIGLGIIGLYVLIKIIQKK